MHTLKPALGADLRFLIYTLNANHEQGLRYHMRNDTDRESKGKLCFEALLFSFMFRLMRKTRFVTFWPDPGEGVIWVSKRRRNQDEFIHNLKATHPYNLRSVCEDVVQDAHSEASPWGWSQMFGYIAWKQIAPTICDMYAKIWSKMHTLKLALGGDLR